MRSQPSLKLSKSQFEVIKSGFQYLEQLPGRYRVLQGPIAANVKFAADFATNFKLAGEAASQVEQELEQLSVTMGVPLEQLRKTFVDVLEAGGMHFEASLQGAISLTKELTIAVHGHEHQRPRRTALAEIPKLLDGSMTGQSRILETLHMSTAEWNAMLAAAQKNGDLDLELADKQAVSQRD